MERERGQTVYCIVHIGIKIKIQYLNYLYIFFRCVCVCVSVRKVHENKSQLFYCGASYWRIATGRESLHEYIRM